MCAAPAPPDPGAVAGHVGPGAFARGAAYRDQGRVLALDWDPAMLRLQGTVHGSAPTYRASVWLRPGSERLGIARSVCTCPVQIACKHVAALLLEAHRLGLGHGSTGAGSSTPAGNTPGGSTPTASTPGDGPGSGGTISGALSLSAWRRTLDRLPVLSPPALPEQARAVPLGLQFRVGQDRKGPTTTHEVSVRPVRRAATGTWSAGRDVGFDALAYPAWGVRWEPVAHGWLLELAALRKPSAAHFGSSTWESLRGFQARLLWPHLARAAELGVPLLGPDGAQVRLAQGGELALDLTIADSDADSDAEGDGNGAGLLLMPTMTLDGEPVAAAVRGTVGDGGLFAVVDDELVLGPCAERLSLTAIELLGVDPVVVPASDTAEFWSAYHPRLARQITLTSSDGSVVVPDLPPPTLRVTAVFEGPGLVQIGCSWEYVTVAGPVEFTWQASVRDAASRDLPAEQRVLDAVARTVRGLPVLQGTRLDATLTLTDTDALDAAEVLLPALAAVDGVRVHTEHEPAYRELTGAPAITVATVDTERTDWFDLAVTVRVGDHDVPLRALIEALGADKKRLMMVDGSWLRLDHPSLDRLRDLLEEAARLADRPGRPHTPRVSRYHAGLWEDLDELADHVDVSESWRASVGGLLALRSGSDLPSAGDDDGARPHPLPPPPGLAAELRPYQSQGFAWLAFCYRHGLGGILADDMGLGKTLQTLALVAHARTQHAEAGAPPFLVVAPASVVSNWAAEAARFTPGLRVVTRTTTSTRAAAPLPEEVAGADVVVTSYAIFRLDFEAFEALAWAGLILDEAQFVKNHTSRVNACARTLTAPFKLAITGTPMENDVGELWALLSIVAPGLYPSRRRFAEDFVRPLSAGARPGAAPDVRRFAASRAALLRRRVRPLMLRRTKEQVAPELPARQEQVVHVDLAPAHRRAYDARLQRERTRVLGLLDDVDGNRLAIFKSLTTLRRMALDASLVDPGEYDGVPSSKLDVLVEQLGEVVAEGHRALVFSQFTGYLSLVAARLASRGMRFASLDGATRRRADVIASFRQGDAPLFLISLKAGGFGLNLVEADHVFLLDPWWNPATEAQAVDRTHRIGQTRPVNVVRLVAAGTIEEKVMELKARKAAAVAAVLGDGDDVFSRALDADDIRGLLSGP